MNSKYSLNIISEFEDYYDECFKSVDGCRSYHRRVNHGLQKSEQIAFMRNLGIKTIDIIPSNFLNRADDKLVVYSEPFSHNGNGKVLCSYDEAVALFGSFIASKYVEDLNGVSIKILQVGNRRFRLKMKNSSSNIFKHGEIVECTEILECKNTVGLPIYSIDYINVNGILTATDFNCVENLRELGMEQFIDKHEVAYEIYKLAR